MDHIFHQKVLTFIEYYNSEYDCVYKYIKNIELDDINKEYFDAYGYQICTYNYFLINYMHNFIDTIYYWSENPNLYPTKLFITYKPIFIDLLEFLLKNNINNIKYDFTLITIVESYYGFRIINMLESHGYLHLLARINPNKYKWRNEKHKKRAENLYEKTTELQMALIKTVIKAQIHIKISPHIFADCPPVIDFIY